MDFLISCHLYWYQYFYVKKILYQNNDNTVYPLIYFDIISLFLSRLSTVFITSRFLYSPHPKVGRHPKAGEITLTLRAF